MEVSWAVGNERFQSRFKSGQLERGGGVMNGTETEVWWMELFNKSRMAVTTSCKVKCSKLQLLSKCTI